MPDNDSGEKTEEATPRKLNNARKEGQVPMSTEVNTAGLLIVGFVALIMLGPKLYQAFAGVMVDSLGPSLAWELTDRNAMVLMGERYVDLTALLIAMLGIAFITALILGLSQAGLFFTAKPLQPKWERLSPISGFKRLFGLRGLMRMVFSILKMLVVTTMAWWVIHSDIVSCLYISRDLASRFVDLAWLLVLLGLKIAATLAIIAAFDFLYQRFQHSKDQMMSKQEVKDENKQAEGDPLIKSRIRQVQRQMAQNRMMQEVPDADVVITNPTHVAVALKYDQQTMDAPVVVAKGYDLIAQRIKQIASDNDIIMVENVPLARGLAKKVEIGHMVPVDFYQQVAEILSYVYRLKKKTA